MLQVIRQPHRKMNQNTERVTQEKDLWDTLKLVKSLFNKGISQIYFIFKFTILLERIMSS